MYVTNSCNWGFRIKALLNKVELVPFKQLDAVPSIVAVSCVLHKIHCLARYCIILGFCQQHTGRVHLKYTSEIQLKP